MLFVLCFCLAISSLRADVSHVVNQDPILKQSLDIGADGVYEWNYETGNGIIAQEQGALKNIGKEDEAQSAQGSAQWTAPNGEKVQFSYVADENGYQPQGSHIPAIPEAILRSLEYIKQHPAQTV